MNHIRSTYLSRACLDHKHLSLKHFTVHNNNNDNNVNPVVNWDCKKLRWRKVYSHISGNWWAEYLTKYQKGEREGD